MLRKNFIILICLFLVTFAIFTIYRSSLINQDNTNKPELYILTFEADLTHDGSNEYIYIDLTQIKDTETATIKIVDVNENIIWEESASIPHAGWNSLFLCTVDNNQYLLRYNPYMIQGEAIYQYELFYLDERGEDVIVKSNQLIFNITPEGLPLDIENIVAFVNEVNMYLNSGIILLSTQDSQLVYSTKNNPIVRTETLSWLNEYDIPYNVTDSLEAKLKKYQNYLESVN